MTVLIDIFLLAYILLFNNQQIFKYLTPTIHANKGNHREQLFLFAQVPP